MNWRKQVDDFKDGLKIEAPLLGGACIRFGFFGSVAGGKSVTAGIFSVGITPKGLIGWIDGEGRRSVYAIDQVADMAVKKYGGDKQAWLERFKVIHIDPPFNPLRAVAAIEALEAAGCQTVILDLLSQCWDSDGGYLDMKDEEVYRMAGDDDKKRERSAASAAAHIKPWTHQKLVNKVNASKCHLVLLFQAKAKYNPKTFRPDDFVTPIQESGLTRTAIAVGRVEAKMVNDEPCGGFCTFRGGLEQGTKFTHPEILKLLPKNGEQFKFEHAEALLAWVSTGNKFAQPKPVDPIKALTAAEADLKAVKKSIWDLTAHIHRGNSDSLQTWMHDEFLMGDTEWLKDLTLDTAKVLLGLVKAKLEKQKEVTP